MACLNVCQGGDGMGLGPMGEPGIIHKRKFRFTLEIMYCNNKWLPGCFVKTAGRPDITIEETEINYLNGKTWIPGKAVFEPITVTYYDVSSSNHIDLLSWLASIYDFTDRTCAHQASRRSDYTGMASITLFDGCGNSIETWTYRDMWPTSVKFGDLDMTSSDVCEIELTMRYSNISYQNFCVGGQPFRCPCTPCTNVGLSASANVAGLVGGSVQVGL